MRDEGTFKLAVLALFFFINMPLLLCPANALDFYQVEGGPRLVVETANAVLERGVPDEVEVVLRNDGFLANRSLREEPSGRDEEALAALEAEYESWGDQALGIEATLRSSDARVEVISGPQVAGSLTKGTATVYPLEFAVLVDPEAGVGVYPLELELNYGRLSSVQVSGDPGFPEVYFYYVNVTETLALEAEVVQGPELSVAAEGSARPGGEAGVEVTVQNGGDVAVSDLTMRVEAQAPLFARAGPASLGDIEPGKSGSATLTVKVPEGTAPGYYPLSCTLCYPWEGSVRVEEMAVLVEVRGGWLPARSLPYALLVLALLAAAGVYFGFVRGRIRGRGRW